MHKCHGTCALEGALCLICHQLFQHRTSPSPCAATMGHYHKDMNLVLILFSRCQNVPVRKKNIIFIRSDESPAPKYSETRKADVQKIQNKYIKKTLGH